MLYSYITQKTEQSELNFILLERKALNELALFLLKVEFLKSAHQLTDLTFIIHFCQSLLMENFAWYFCIFDITIIRK